MRYLLLIACVLTATLGFLSWAGNRGRETTEVVHREVREAPARIGAGDGRTTSVQRSTREPTSSLRSEALTIALATISAALLLAVAFWSRLSEIRIGNMWFKLLDAKRMRQVRQRTDDPDKALEALEIAVRTMNEAVAEGEHVSEKLADDAIDAAVAQVQAELGKDVDVVDGELPEVTIHGEPREGEDLWATSEPQYLPSGQFPAELAAAIQDEGGPGAHRIYVLEGLDVLAAISYDTPTDSPLLLHVVATRNDRDELRASALAAALLATRYLHVVGRKLSRPPGLAIATGVGRAAPVTLQELGFRPARHDETPGLPEGEYWLQTFSSGG